MIRLADKKVVERYIDFSSDKRCTGEQTEVPALREEIKKTPNVSSGFFQGGGILVTNPPPRRMKNVVSTVDPWKGSLFQGQTPLFAINLHFNIVDGFGDASLKESVEEVGLDWMVNVHIVTPLRVKGLIATMAPPSEGTESP